MQVENLKKALQQYYESPGSFIPARHLISTLSEAVLQLMAKSPQEDIKQECSEEPLITLMEFYERTHICHPSSLCRLFKSDKNFLRLCGIKSGCAFLVRQDRTINYLANLNQRSPLLKKRAQSFLKNRKDKGIKCQ